MPPFPDQYLNPETLSLEEFVAVARKIGDEDDEEGFVNFVLAGRCNTSLDDLDPPTLEPTRIFVNPRLNLAAPENYTVHGDFDSIIGLTRLLPFTKGISWQCYPQFADTLTTDVHIKVPIERGTGTLQVPLHKIPNYMCLKFDIRHQGRLFFPRRYEPHVPPTLPEDFCTAVYERAILPAVRACSSSLAAHWPNNYAHVTRLARVQRGHLSSVSRDLPATLLPRFAEELMQRLDSMGGGFRDAFFELEAKGVKATSFHDPSDDEARRTALEGVLNPIDIHAIPIPELQTRWWVDVALEVHEEGSVLLWLSESHTRLIRHALPNVTVEQSGALARSDGYIQDFNAHLTSISGFRLEPRSRGAWDHVTYVNVYTTDKSVTYQTKPGLYRRRVCSDLYPKAMPQLLADLLAITTTFSECGGHDGVAQDGCTRIEIRANIHYARTSLTGIPDDLVQLSVLSVPSVLWWYFKFYRMSAIYRVFTELSTTPPAARLWVPSLMLGSACIYMLNAIIFRPSTRRVEAELARQCAYWCHPHYSPTDADNIGANFDDELLQLCTLDRGLYFLSYIVRDEEHRFLRLPPIRQIDRTDLAILYGKTNMKDIHRAMGGTVLGVHGLTRANKLRTKNRAETLPVTQLRGQLSLHAFNFAAQGLTRQMDIQMTGPDVVPRADDDEDEAEGSLDEVFSQLWAQLPSDIVQQSPNFRHRTLPAYIKLTLGDRDKVSIDLFKAFELPFDSVYVRLCTPSQWRELVFDKFFPTPNTKIPDTLQNFRQCLYFQAYIEEIGRLLPADVARSRDALWALFQELRWMPHPYSERMWSTKRRAPGHGWYALPEGHQDLAVHIAINPKYYVSLDAITLSSGPRPATGNEEDDDAAWVELSRRIQFIRQSIPGPDSIIRPGDGQEILTSIQRLSQSNSGAARHSTPGDRHGAYGSLPPPLRPGRVPALAPPTRHGRRGDDTVSTVRSSGPPGGHASPAESSASRAGRHRPIAQFANFSSPHLPLFHTSPRVRSTPSEPEVPRTLARTPTPLHHIFDNPSSMASPSPDPSDFNHPSTPPHSDWFIDLTSPEGSPRASPVDSSVPQSEAGSSSVLTIHRSSTPPPLALQPPTTPRKSVRVRTTLHPDLEKYGPLKPPTF